MSDWTNGARVHGPSFADWLEATAPDAIARATWMPGQVNAYAPSEDWILDAISRARRGRNLSFTMVDRLLTRLGHHVSEVPDEFWQGLSRLRGERQLGCSGCGVPFDTYTPGCRPCVQRKSTHKIRGRLVAA